MRWEDERYVRIYTRDTADWLALSFDAQALFVLLLRKVDRAGLLRLGKHGRRAVAVVLGQTAAWPRLEPALAELLADGCLRLEGDTLVVPNFIEAQEAAMSDRQRKAEQRARARDQVTPSRDEPSRNVTGSHAPSEEVTPGHAASQEVTPSCAVPCCAEPEAAAARASARDGAITMTGPGEAEADPPSPSAEASPGPAPAPKAQQPVDDDLPRRPLRLVETSDLGPLGAEWRCDLERASGWKIVLAAVGRRDQVRTDLEAACEALGLERAVVVCLPIVERRKRHGLGPPGSWAFFLPALQDAIAGKELMPPEARVEPLTPEARQDAKPAGEVWLFTRERWEPLAERLGPLAVEQLRAEIGRMVAAVESEGLWTSARNAKLAEVEEFLWTKWSGRAAAGGG